MYKGYKELNKVYNRDFPDWGMYPDIETVDLYIWTIGKGDKIVKLIYDKINGGVTIGY